MSKAEPTIQKYMTTQPHFIMAEKTIADARLMMEDLKIRHLPVMKDEKIMGIVSDRDIKMALGYVGAEPYKMKVADVCHGHPYQVHPDAKLHEVIDEMATHHYGSAVVVQNDKLVGIFTTVDVCKALSDILEQRFHGH